jgi:hypothetical protein
MSFKDSFSPEEIEHLNCLGSMLSRPNTQFEQEVQEALDNIQRARELGWDGNVVTDQASRKD